MLLLRGTCSLQTRGEENRWKRKYKNLSCEISNLFCSCEQPPPVAQSKKLIDWWWILGVSTTQDVILLSVSATLVLLKDLGNLAVKFNTATLYFQPWKYLSFNFLFSKPGPQVKPPVSEAKSGGGGGGRHFNLYLYAPPPALRLLSHRVLSFALCRLWFSACLSVSGPSV